MLFGNNVDEYVDMVKAGIINPMKVIIITFTIAVKYIMSKNNSPLVVKIVVWRL
jgi:hypothetical protein